MTNADGFAGYPAMTTKPAHRYGLMASRIGSQLAVVPRYPLPTTPPRFSTFTLPEAKQPDTLASRQVKKAEAAKAKPVYLPVEWIGDVAEDDKPLIRWRCTCKTVYPDIPRSPDTAACAHGLEWETKEALIAAHPAPSVMRDNHQSHTYFGVLEIPPSKDGKRPAALHLLSDEE